MTVAAPRRAFFRKSLVVPTEHGAWSWLLVPWLTGAVVGLATPVSAPLPFLALLLTLVGGLSAYMIRQPATAWVRIRRGRGRKADQPLALGWTLGFSLVALLCLLGLFLLGRVALLGLAIPFAVILVAYLLAARRGRAGADRVGGLHRGHRPVDAHRVGAVGPDGLAECDRRLLRPSAAGRPQGT